MWNISHGAEEEYDTQRTDCRKQSRKDKRYSRLVDL